MVLKFLNKLLGFFNSTKYKDSIGSKNIVIPIGLPRSGKSTLSKQYEDKGYALLGRDIIRKQLLGSKEDHSKEGEVTNLFNKRLEELMKEGRNIFIDNTNLSYKYRKEFYARATKHGYDISIIILNTPIDTILERCKESNFPKEVIDKMISSYNYFDIDFPEVQYNMNVQIINSDNKDINLFWEEYSSKYKEYNQHSKHHSLTLISHMTNAFESLREENYELQTAGLLHDIGKPYTKKFKEDGEACYYNHHHYSAYIIYTELQTGSLCKEKVMLLARHHMCWFMRGDIEKYFDKLKESFNRFDITREELEILHTADKSAH